MLKSEQIHLILVINIFLANHCIRAQPGPQEVDFGCMTGNNVGFCVEGTGSSRFVVGQNSTINSCLTAEKFLQTASLRSSRSGREIYACVSFFKWTIEDTYPNKMNTFVEEHACLHDTNENIISALELSDSNECSKTSKRWNKQTVHYKICVCKGTRDCNVKFNSDFPNEPKEITSTICGNGGHKFYTEAQETTENSTSKTSSKSRSGMGLLLLQALLIIGTL